MPTLRGQVRGSLLPYWEDSSHKSEQKMDSWDDDDEDAWEGSEEQNNSSEDGEREDARALRFVVVEGKRARTGGAYDQLLATY